MRAVVDAREQGMGKEKKKGRCGNWLPMEEKLRSEIIREGLNECQGGHDGLGKRAEDGNDCQERRGMESLKRKRTAE